MSARKILNGLQLATTIYAIYLTPIPQCSYAASAFAIGLTHALGHLLVTKVILSFEMAMYFKLMLAILESLQNFAMFGLMNMEFHRLSKKYSVFNMIFCVPLIFDILKKIVCEKDDLLENVMMHAKCLNVAVYAILVRHLAANESNIWLHGIWMVLGVLLYQFRFGNKRSIIEPMAYLMYYGFSACFVYDDAFMDRWEWFGFPRQ